MTEPASPPVTYPAQWEADVVLRDGSMAHVRPIRPEDADGVRRFHAGQSDESIYLRFFAPLKQLSDRDVARFTEVDYHDRVALVATARDEIIGIARYDRIDATTAEVAFNISDAYQGRGVGSVLLEHLAAIAQEEGVRRFVADVLPQNRKMISVFTEAGYEVSHHYDDGVIAVSFTITPTEQSQAVVLAREHRAESVSMRGVLFPRAVAVVGASRRADSIGHLMLQNILAGGFTGSVFAVNPEAARGPGPAVLRPGRRHRRPGRPGRHRGAGGVRPGRRPRLRGRRRARACSWSRPASPRPGRRGRSASASCCAPPGPAACGWSARTRSGSSTPTPTCALNASLAPALPPPGRLGLFAQSGALGVAVLASAARRGLGVSTSPRAGNRVDVSRQRPHAVLDRRRRHRRRGALPGVAWATRASSPGSPGGWPATKPVIVVKSGGLVVRRAARPPGARDPRAARCVRRDAAPGRRDPGRERPPDVRRRPAGRAPAAARAATRVADRRQLRRARRADRRGVRSAGTSRSSHGPVSLPADAPAARVRRGARRGVRRRRTSTASSTCFIPPAGHPRRGGGGRRARGLGARADKTCVATFLGMRGVHEALPADLARRAGAVVPAYAMPEDAVRALAAATRYGEWRARGPGDPGRPRGHRPARGRAAGRPGCSPTPDGRSRWSHDELRAAAGAATASRVWPHRRGAPAPTRRWPPPTELGYPVVLKSTSPLLRHRAGARRRARSTWPARRAARARSPRCAARLGRWPADAFVVQPMADRRACRAWSAPTEDPLFGPVVSLRASPAPPTELLGDVAHRHPAADRRRRRRPDPSVRAAPLLLRPPRRRAGRPRRPRGPHRPASRCWPTTCPRWRALELNPVNAHAGRRGRPRRPGGRRPGARRTDTGRPRAAREPRPAVRGRDGHHLRMTG